MGNGRFRRCGMERNYRHHSVTVAELLETLDRIGLHPTTATEGDRNCLTGSGAAYPRAPETGRKCLDGGLRVRLWMPGRR